MSELDRSVNVDITKEEASITQQGFGEAMCLGVHKNFNERIKAYSSTEEMLTDGFKTTDAEYISATNYFSANPHPEKFYVGRRSVDEVIYKITGVEDATEYTVNVNAMVAPYNFTSGVGTTDLLIVAGIVSDIQADAGRVVEAADIGGGEYTLTAKVVDATYTVVVDSNQTVQAPLAPTAAIDADISAVFQEDSDWYGFAENLHIKTDALLLAAWAEANKRLYITATDEADIVDVAPSSDTTSLAAIIDSADYSHTAAWYYHDLAKQPESGWFGRALPAVPGSINWAYLNLQGIPTTKLSTTQYGNLFAKRANAYSTIIGANVTRFGTNGIDYIDITRIIDWLTARIQEELFGLLVRVDKVEQTDGGIASAESMVRDVLLEGVNNNAIAAEPAFTVTAPLMKDISLVDRGNRLLPDLDFTCTLTGAFNKVNVVGKVRV